MGLGVSDEAIGDVKLVADEGMVTYLRVKLRERDRKLESKGGTH